MKVVGIIPCRMASSRFPGKPLADLLGLPMVLHVYERARRSSLLSEVVVATCDEEIRRVVESHGGRVIMTSARHERGTDRVAEAAEHLSADVVVNIQGDEPLLDPRMIEQVSAPLIHTSDTPICNLIRRLDSPEEARDPNLVKVVFTTKMKALYYSREPIPTDLHRPDRPLYRQLGIIAFTREFLRTFSRLAPTTLEKLESVDLMRVVEHGYSITLVETSHPVYSVDTPPELEHVAQRMATDELARAYLPRGVNIHG